MDDKINEALNYYAIQKQDILDFINNNLMSDIIIKKGEQLAVLEYKLTALQVALEN